MRNAPVCCCGSWDCVAVWASAVFHRNGDEFRRRNSFGARCGCSVARVRPGPSLCGTVLFALQCCTRDSELLHEVDVALVKTINRCMRFISITIQTQITMSDSVQFSSSTADAKSTYMSNGYRMNSSGYLANPTRSAQVAANNAGALTRSEASRMGLPLGGRKQTLVRSRSLRNKSPGAK
jgi:hypothetical protein